MGRPAITDVVVTFRATNAERKAIRDLAALFERTESDTLRVIVREAARAQGLLPPVGAGQGQQSAGEGRG